MSPLSQVHQDPSLRERPMEALPAAALRGPVVVCEAGRFEGLLAFRGRARVEGELDGQIVSNGTLWLGEKARVTGSIEVDELIIEGSFEGVATARARIELAPTARVRGTVRAPRVAMGDGCVLEGRCETAGLVGSLG